MVLFPFGYISTIISIPHFGGKVNLSGKNFMFFFLDSHKAVKPAPGEGCDRTRQKSSFSLNRQYAQRRAFHRYSPNAPQKMSSKSGKMRRKYPVFTEEKFSSWTFFDSLCSMTKALATLFLHKKTAYPPHSGYAISTE